MPRSQDEDALSDQALSEFSLFLEFDDLTSRYLNTQNLAYFRTTNDCVADFATEMFRRKTMLEVLRMGTSWFLETLDLTVACDWYVADRARLSRHTVLLALFPDAYDSPNIRAGGPLNRSLLAERKAISEKYPHLYDPQSWGEVAPEGIELPNLKQDLEDLELDQSDLDEDEFDAQAESMVRMELLFEKVWEVYPSYLEESLAIQNGISLAFDEISREGVGLRSDIAELLRTRDPGSVSVLYHFVIESLIFRFMLEEGLDATEKRAEPWASVDDSRESPLRPFSSEDVERSLTLLDELFSDPETSDDRMMVAAQAMADLNDTSSSWNMTSAVLVRCEGTESWIANALQGVMNLRASGGGIAEKLSREILAKGEEAKDKPLIAAGLIAMTLTLHSLERWKESESYHKRMMNALLSGMDDPLVLFLYPAAAWECLDMNAKQDARRLASVGLKAMPEDVLDDFREELLQVRRMADQVERKKRGSGEFKSKAHK
ncbi:MAG: hypothetical protein ABR986_09110 [Methanomassiliicoccales archaeon]|jgi:hypothetical protein